MKKYLTVFALILSLFIISGCGSKKDKVETLSCKYVIEENTMVYEYTYKNDEIESMKETDNLVLNVSEDEYDEYVDIIEETLKNAYDKEGIEFKITRNENKKNIKIEITAYPDKIADEDKEELIVHDKNIDDMKDYLEDQEFVCTIK